MIARVKTDQINADKCVLLNDQSLMMLPASRGECLTQPAEKLRKASPLGGPALIQRTTDPSRTAPLPI